jgi:hypothetical protein
LITSRPSNRFRKWAIGVALLIAAAIVATTVWNRAIQIDYHNWRMRANFAAHLEQPPESISGGLSAISVGTAHAAYERHRDRLVELGAIDRHDITLTHIRRPSPESKHFIRWLLRDAKRPFIDWTSPAPPDGDHPLQFTIWCYSSDSEECTQMFLDRDIPDYAARFMAQNTN